jgi:hypothetical protein
MPRRKKCKVFVSYSRHDEALVKPLAGLLGAAANDAVFLDVTSIRPGDDWKSEINEALQEASVFIVCWCCASFVSSMVEDEVARALKDKNKRLVPVRFCDAPLPFALQSRQWTDLRGRVVHTCSRQCLAHKQTIEDERDHEPTVVASARRHEVALDPSDVAESKVRFRTTPIPFISLGMFALAFISLMLVKSISIEHLSTSFQRLSASFQQFWRNIAPILLAIWLAVVVFRWIREMLQRHKRRNAERLEATVRSYFESIGQTR